MEAALTLEHLAKTYRVGLRRTERKAVTDIDLQVEAGTVFGLLGPNGAGKTTTIKIAVGFLRPDSGSVRIFGEPATVKARSRIGFLPEHPYFYMHLTAEAGLDFYGRLFGLKKSMLRERTKELLNIVGLADAAKLPLGKFSKGMLQRFGIAQALINDPDLLIVDEPTSGLDPIGQLELRNILKALNDKGKSILLSSHYLSEVENFCDEVAIINKGTVIARGRVEKLLSAGDIYRVSASSLPKRFMPIASSATITSNNGLLHVNVRKDELDQLIDEIRHSGGHIGEVKEVSKSLEELFIKLVGGNAHGN